MTYAEYIDVRKNSSIKVDKTDDQLSQKEIDAINKKRSSLNIIGHICVVFFIAVCIIFGLICLLKAFGGDGNIVTNTVKKAVGK